MTEFHGPLWSQDGELTIYSRENEKSFNSKKTNLGVAPKMRLPCTTCGQEFQSKKKLLNHMFHHDDNKERVYPPINSEFFEQL